MIIGPSTGHDSGEHNIVMCKKLYFKIPEQNPL